MELAIRIEQMLVRRKKCFIGDVWKSGPLFAQVLKHVDVRLSHTSEVFGRKSAKPSSAVVLLYAVADGLEGVFAGFKQGVAGLRECMIRVGNRLTDFRFTKGVEQVQTLHDLVSAVHVLLFLLFCLRQLLTPDIVRRELLHSFLRAALEYFESKQTHRCDHDAADRFSQRSDVLSAPVAEREIE